MKDYQPNFNDPRVIRQTTKAIEFVETYIHKTPVPSSKSQWVKHVGQLQLPLNKFLRDKLLICEDAYFNWNTHVCKKYVRNDQGLVELRTAIGLSSVKLTPSLQTQLDTGDFEMTEKSDRFHNPIQYIPRKIRDPLLFTNGYKHNYDIECAAPTLLYQYAKKQAAAQGRWLELPYIENFLNDRSSVRNELSIKHNISSDKIKQMLTGLFQGAHLSLSHTTRIFHLLNGNYNHIRALKADPYMIELLAEIKSMWKEITPSMKQQLNKKRINGRDKAAKYRELEKEVMSVIKKELRKTKNKFLEIHDGWSCRDVCDIRQLIDCVRYQTGYVIKIDWEMYEE
jgi:hypothetical protein